MFRIKICGITNIDDALVVARAGADAIGLNFFAKSPRSVPVAVAREIVAALPKEMTKVGLFVNAPASEACRTADDLGLDVIQLHGDEPPEFLSQLGKRRIMRAFRLGPEGLRPVAEYLDRCGALNAMPEWVLLDAHVSGEYGGTGQKADWALAASYTAELDRPPLVLAGGLNPRNVAEAIQAVRPAAVDTASGVESSPGRKDPEAIAAFVQAAKDAWMKVNRPRNV